MPTDSIAQPGGTSELSDAIYQNIARNISEGSCVLFLGPSAVTSKQSDGSYKPLTELCANQLAKGLGLSKEEEDSLYHVASNLRIRAQPRQKMHLRPQTGPLQRAVQRQRMHHAPRHRDPHPRPDCEQPRIHRETRAPAPLAAPDAARQPR